MQTYELIAHPDHPPLAVSAIGAKSWWDGPDWLRLRWRIEGAGRLVVPALAGRRRADGLWRRTCFELFLADGEAYREFNFAPSEAWAAYGFSGYREGMRELPMDRAPVISWRGGRSGTAILDVAVPGLAPPSSGEIAITAVIEEDGAHKSFWALRHPAGAPDFHHRDCFAANLPPPEAV